MPLMRKLTLNFCHFQIHDLMRAKVTEVGPPMPLVAPSLDLSPTVVPDLALMYWPRTKSGHLSSFSSCREVGWSWRQVLIMEIEWCWCRWDGTGVTRPSWFDVSISDGLSNQPPAIAQTYWFGTELGLFANPTDGSWPGECGTHLPPIEQGSLTWASHCSSC